MLNCPKCSRAGCPKAGIVKGRQRYTCKECHYFYTVESRGVCHAIKRQALVLYLEGLGFRSIGRILNFSHVTIYKWIKEFGEKLQVLKSDKALKVVEMDEMHSYVGSKKTIAGYGLLLIDMEKNSSIALLACGMPLPEKNCGTL